jgi:hypothetical protein
MQNRLALFFRQFGSTKSTTQCLANHFGSFKVYERVQLGYTGIEVEPSKRRPYFDAAVDRPLKGFEHDIYSVSHFTTILAER